MEKRFSQNHFFNAVLTFFQFESLKFYMHIRHESRKNGPRKNIPRKIVPG